jgi:PRTRC genetic system protein A
MKHDIIPHYSCVVDKQNFSEAQASGYSEIYIPDIDGKFLKHVKLSGGRHVRIKVDSVPKAISALLEKDPVLSEELNFLPAGKVPKILFDQIVEFFRKVMDLKKADYEAHAWILWHKDRGYFISIPPQSVSKASVRFDYNDESLPPGSVIVVDIHSHNTMGAFYSSTDNNNDRSGIYYSGVIGKLSNHSYEYVIRFNLYEDKRACKLEDIFETPAVHRVEIPNEWLDKVEVPAYAAPKDYLTAGLGNPQTRYPHAKPHFRNWMEGVSSHPKTNEDEKSLDPKTGMKSLWESQEDLARSRRANPGVTSPQNTRPRIDRDEEEDAAFVLSSGAVYPAGALEHNSGDLSNDGFGTGFQSPSLRELWDQESREEPRSAMEEYFLSLGVEEISGDDLEAMADKRLQESISGTEVEDSDITLGGEYEYYSSKYSSDVADAKDSIDTELGGLENCDEALLDIIRQAYEMLGPTGKEDLQTNGF